jgi:hypothetical protein
MILCPEVFNCKELEMIITVSQAEQSVRNALPNFHVSTSQSSLHGRSQLNIAIVLLPGQQNSRGESLPTGSYKANYDIQLFSGGVDDADVEIAIDGLKSIIRTHDTSNGWTNLF